MLEWYIRPRAAHMLDPVDEPSLICILRHFLSGTHVGFCYELEIMFGLGALRCKNLTLVHVNTVFFDSLFYVSEDLVKLLVFDALIIE